MIKVKDQDFLRFLRRFVLEPMLAQRSVLVTVVFALLFLSATQGLVLVIVKGFMSAFFANASADFISIGDLLPAKLSERWSSSKSMTFKRDFLVWFVPCGIVVVGVVKAYASYLYNLSLMKLSLRVAQNYREKVFESVLTLPWLSSAQRTPGEWMSIIMADAIFIQSRLTDFSTAFVKDGVLIASCLIALAFIHWPAALVLLFVTPFIAWQMGRAGRRIAWFTEAFQRELGVLAGQLLGIRERFRYMRAQHGEDFECEKFESGNRAYLDMMTGSIFIRALVAPGMELVGFSLFAIFIYGWTRQVPGFDVAPDVVLQFFVALGLILRPVRELGEQVARWSETIGGLKRSMAVAREVDSQRATAGIHAGIKKIKTEVLIQKIVINHLAIAYGSRPVFRASNIVLNQGAAVAIVGPSGSGKSTILRVFAGLVRPSLWESQWPWEDVASNASMVSQSPFLFKDSIRGNLTYGLDAAALSSQSDDKLWAALNRVNLERMVRALPDGLDTVFNPLETNLSGGQIQRLVIARAVLREPTILLLDEATSAVDAATEQDISKRLIETVRREKKIMLAVTHRLKILNEYDEVWFIENGDLLLRGKHTDLLSNERYRIFSMTEDHP